MYRSRQKDLKLTMSQMMTSSAL